MGSRQPATRDALERGRRSYRHHAWAEAFDALADADRAAALALDDLEMLAWSAALSGHDDACLERFEQLHRRCGETGAHARAARWGFWLGMRLMAMGEMGRSAGWLSRAQRSLECADGDCVERGYLLLPKAARHLGAAELDTAVDIAARAVAIGEQFGDADLSAFARQFECRALLRRGDIEHGMTVLDESMIAVAAGELSPLVTGLVYCSAIATCQQAMALDRAREWTAALAAWCAGESQLASFAGACLVHRSQILKISGDWAEALEEAKRACERVSDKDPQALGDACYERAELHRLRGELTEAEAAYRHASQVGREPQPGLALLRLAQGRIDDAASAIRRVLATTSTAWRRPQFLPACVDILLAAGELDDARIAAAELDQLTRDFDIEILHALAAQARGCVSLADGDPEAAVEPLRRAFQCWQSVGAPYIAARLRVQLAQAYEALGDRDGAELERQSARQVFEALGAAPDLAALDGKPAKTAGGLSSRELEVLRLVARGKTNKQIANQLYLSERTIDRHVSNIFHKLHVSTRAAATAYAYEHSLL